MQNTTKAGAVLLLATLFGAPGMAQTMSGATPNAGDVVQRGNLSPDQQKLQEDTYARLRAKSGVTKQQAVEQVSAVLGTLNLSCKASDAFFLGESKGDGTSSKIYETSCESGLGYFVVSADKPSVVSCFAAEATRAKDEAAGRPPGQVCTMPANKDVKAMAQTVLTKLGTQCAVKEVRWIGVSAAASTEYTEAACTDGTGHVIVSGVPGSAAPVSALSCADAAKRGIFCKLTQTAQAPAITLQTFRDALLRHGITCSAGDATTRSIGQETTLKRHVVEFKCYQYPAGLVAFIPLSDSTAKFETMDCATAAKRGAICKLTP